MWPYTFGFPHADSTDLSDEGAKRLTQRVSRTKKIQRHCNLSAYELIGSRYYMVLELAVPFLAAVPKNF